MRASLVPLTLAALILCPGLAVAQAPLSAIDWLNDTAPNPLSLRPDLLEPPVSPSAGSPQVEVSELDAVRADAVGLLSASVTGLPSDLWKNSDPTVLASLMAEQRVENLPAMQALFYTLLLAETDPPHTGADDKAFLGARLDELLALGAVEPAQAMMDRAGPNMPGLFDRWFDATLLTGDEDHACRNLQTNPTLTRSYAARVYCSARFGEWRTAALTLSTGRALGLVSDQEDVLLRHFLDPELFEGEVLPHPPVRPTPLVFRLREAVGEPMPTAPLPRPFAVSDLRGTSGWKAQIEAAERLAQTGALSGNRLLGVYSEREAAASGGIWDRVDAIQQLEVALTRADPQAVGRALPKAFAAMRVARLEVPFAKLFAEPLLALPLKDQAAELAYRLGLMSPQYEKFAQDHGDRFPQIRFLTALAKGTPQNSPARTQIEQAIQQGFTQDSLPAVFAPDANDRRLGEIILRAMLRYQRAVAGETHEMTTALATLRALGLEDAARQAALHAILLERGF